MVISSINVAMDNNILWHERDISHSSTERIYLPDDLNLIVYMSRRLNNIVSKLVVNEERMSENINMTYGVIYSGRVMNYLIDNREVTREEIYDSIQKLCFEAMESKVNLKDLILNDSFFNKLISKQEVDELFDYQYVFKNIDKIYKKVGI